MTRRGAALFAAMCVIWGVPYLLIKVAIGDLSPASVVFARTAIGALLLVPVAARRGHLRPLLPRWRPLLAYTVAEIAVPWLLLSDAERHLASSLTGLLVAAVPLAGALLARTSGDREPLDARRVAGLAVGLLGVGALLGLDPGAVSARPLAEMGVVVVGYALGPLILARHLSDLPGLGVVAASLAVCALAYAPVAAVQLPRMPPPGRVTAAVVALGVVCTAVAFVVFFHLIAEVGPVRATVITFLNPAVAVVLGAGLLGERVTAGTVVGFALVLVGSYLSTRRRAVPAAAPLG